MLETCAWLPRNFVLVLVLVLELGRWGSGVVEYWSIEFIGESPDEKPGPGGV
jgi:hypothetical protein